MEDREIVNLYWKRDSNAIKETATKYGAYCRTIAMNILGNNEDMEECINDTYLRAWNSMPTNRPNTLSTYLGKIVRNLSFDKVRYKSADKRGGGELELVLEELGECVSGSNSVEQEIEKNELVRELNCFLDALTKEKCNIFLCRYWYAMPISEIATRFGMSEGNVSVTLKRIRDKMKMYLKERGYDL